MEEEKVVEQENVNINNEEYLKLKRKNNKNKVIIIILAFVIILLLALVLLYYLNNKDKNEPENKGNESGQVVDNKDNNEKTDNNVENDKSYVNTFKYNNGEAYGIAYVTGYVKIEKIANCGVDECPPNEPKDDVVVFYIKNTESEDLKKYIDDDYPEGYNGLKSIQLGCLKNDTITYYNAADDFYDPTYKDYKDSSYVNNKDYPYNYIKIFTLNKDITSKLLKSNANELITLKLEKYKLTHGGEAMSCYSDYANVEVVENN